MFTDIFVIKIGDDFLEVIFAEGCKYFLLVLFADHDVTMLMRGYFMSFYMELMRSNFYYMGV